MSQIYVRWNKIHQHSEQLESCSSRVEDYAHRVNSIKNQLIMSDSVSAQLKAGLSADSQRLIKISKELKRLSSVLDEVAKMYKETERGMIDR